MIYTASLKYNAHQTSFIQSYDLKKDLPERTKAKRLTRMIFNWELALTSLAGGVFLLLLSRLSWKQEKSVFAPATAMLLIWASVLVAHSFLGKMGFFHLSKEAILLFVLGSIWFALIAIVSSKLYNNYLTKLPHSNNVHLGQIDNLNYKRLSLFCLIIAISIYPLMIATILSYGSNFADIASNIRHTSLAGTNILHPITANLFLLLTILSNILLYGVTQRKVNIVFFTIFAISLIVFSLILGGRSGIVTTIIGWIVIVAIFSRKINFQFLILSAVILLVGLYFGGIWLEKFDTGDNSTFGTIVKFFEHVVNYFYQGPVLFSRYFTGEITVGTQWDFLNSTCHLLSKFGLCTPLPLHQEMFAYSESRSGNVYTFYYSIIPLYGLTGLFLVFAVYAIFSSFMYNIMREKRIIGIIFYPFIFSAIIISVFKDDFNATYLFIKMILIWVLIKYYFSNKLNASS